jgi:Family of unknown function (DUF5681)
MASSADDAVGFKRPPKHTRFRPGQSGNPHGRPAGVRNLKSDLLDELREETTIRENGREQRVSKQRAFVKALVAAAIGGDMRATSTLVSFCARSLGGQSDDEAGAAPAASDLDLIENYVARERKRRTLMQESDEPASTTKINE